MPKIEINKEKRGLLEQISKDTSARYTFEDIKEAFRNGRSTISGENSPFVFDSFDEWITLYHIEAPGLNK